MTTLGMNRISRWTSRNVQPSAAGRVDLVVLVGVAIAVLAPDTLIPTGTERPTAILGRRAVAGQKHASDIG